MSDDGEVINGPWQARPAAFVCPHETPGGPQRCALCRREVERRHEGWGRHQDGPYWMRAGRIAERQAVPMPDHVRALLNELRQGRPGGEQGRLL